MPEIVPQLGQKWNEEDRLIIASILLKIGYTVRIKKSGEKNATFCVEFENDCGFVERV